jgi:hypothetical protein
MTDYSRFKSNYMAQIGLSKQPPFVIKRNGEHAKIRFDEITDRLDDLCTNIEPIMTYDTVNTIKVMKKTIKGNYELNVSYFRFFSWHKNFTN